jgi:SAM-dependent methyltransferase
MSPSYRPTWSCPRVVPSLVKNCLRNGDSSAGFKDAVASILIVDWEASWKSVVGERATLGGLFANTGYWDRRAASYARSTQSRTDDLLAVMEPYLSPHKTLIDAGAGTGRHAVPLSHLLEWVTAVEPSEGMRAMIPAKDNMTVVASSWEDAEVAQADLVICSHVLYGNPDPVPFIEKLDRCARDRVFIVMRESDLPHPGAAIRKLLQGGAGPRVPRFSDLFMLLMQMGMAPDVTFLRYKTVSRYANFEEALTDVRAMVGEGWDEAAGRALLEETLTREGDELVYDGGTVLSGVAHWRPLARD